MVPVESVNEIVKALRNGADLDNACAFAGASTAEVYRMLERGKYEAEKQFNGSEPDPEAKLDLELWNTLKKARADAIIANVANIQRAAKAGDWKASAWWLERHSPEIYGKRSKDNPEQLKSITG